MFLYKSLNINILKRRLYFPQNTYDFFQKHVRVFGKSRTCFSGNTYMFLLNHTTGNKSVYGNIQ